MNITRTSPELNFHVGELISPEIMAGLLERGIKQKQCSQAWLGYSEVAFIGFPSQAVSPKQLRGRHWLMPFEVQTNLSTWTLYKSGKVVATLENDRQMATTGISNVVNATVTDVHLGSRMDLTLYFNTGYHLVIEPWTETEHYGSAAWKYHTPTVNYEAVIAANVQYRVREKT